MKKILDGFWAASNKYEAAFQSGDSDAAFIYGNEFRAYVVRYRKELKFSDEYIADMNKCFDKYAKSRADCKLIEAQAAESRREFLEAQRRQNQFYLGMLPRENKSFDN